MTAQRTNTSMPSLAVGVAGAVWGCFWLPTRYFDARGMDGGLLSVTLFAVTIVFLLPWAIWCWRTWRGSARPMLQIAIWAGAAFALYTNALVLTEVVRALLLFYLTPIWGTILGIAMLGERLTLHRTIAICLGISGGLVILGLDLGIPLPRNLGDWMALISGMAWALATVHMARAEGVPVSGQTFAYALGSLVFSIVLLVLLTPKAASVALPQLNAELVAGFLGFALLINLPCMTALIWGAGLLSPGRVGILLCTELAFGVISAAVLTAEPFGLREILGTALIAGAVLVEVSAPSKSPDLLDPDMSGTGQR